MRSEKKHELSFKIWIEQQGRPVLGKGGAEILAQIEKDESVSKTAKRLGMSYRYVWNYLQKIEQAVSHPIVETFRGGKSGGGGAKLTASGKALLDEYKRVEGYLSEILAGVDHQKAISLKIKGRNRLKGKVLSLEKRANTTEVIIEVEKPAAVKALVSRKDAEGLRLKIGDEVEVVVKIEDIVIVK